MEKRVNGTSHARINAKVGLVQCQAHVVHPSCCALLRHNVAAVMVVMEM
jgi:hypothetical protein